MEADLNRIFENQHLLDATEIFRKLNVHKKVWFLPCLRSQLAQICCFDPFVIATTDDNLRLRAYPCIGVIYQARFPSDYVLLLSVQHDCGPHPRRVPLSVKHGTRQTTLREGASSGTLLVEDLTDRLGADSRRRIEP